MKFGRKIKTSLYAEWQENYLNYDDLKKVLKGTSVDGKPWDAQDESAFISRLESELKKCEKFQTSKAEELSTRITGLEKTVVKLVKDYDEAAASQNPGHTVCSSGHLEAQPAQYEEDGGSDDEGEDDDRSMISEDSYDEKFKDLEEEVATLVADVHDLALFTKLNFTGFVKIIKKHDKVTGFALKADFSSEYLDKHPFYKYNYDSLIVKLSRLFDLVRTRGHPVEGDSAAGGSQNAFVRSTTKYWVHDENIVPLKLAVLKHLPVMVFDAKKDFDVKDSAITSIYFDNEELELYLGRLEKTEGAEAIRMRWYGDMSTKLVFVERKTHREDWTGEKSVKARFGIAEHKLNDFLAGKYTMDAEFDEMLKKGKKTAKDVEAMKQLANEVQYAVVTRKLKPVMRSFYNRTAFQLPGDARVRISLDTELSMIREDDFDGKPRAGKNWRRTDIGIDHPFDQLKKEDRELFPYAVLEVKLQTQYGQEPPDWIVDLINSHLVEAVPKFSKFIHGCATLLPERVDLVPFWLPQMDQDIRKTKNPKSKVNIERPTHSGHNSSADNSSQPDSAEADVPSYHEPVSEGEDDEEYMVYASTDEGKRLGLPAGEAEAARVFREKKLKEDNERARANGEDIQSPLIRPVPTKNYGPRVDIGPLESSYSFDQRMSKLDKASLQKLDKKNQDESEDDEEEPMSNEVEYVRHFRAPAGKKISMPVRVEPKVHFANERTFLKWLHFAVLLGTVATGLLNFIPADDNIGLIAAGCFTLTALLAILYSAGNYTWRVIKLRNKEAVEYHDAWGPTLLCGAVIASVLVNLVLRLRDL